MNETKFNPGDVVEFRLNPRIIFHVMERVEQTCPGGTQIHYRGRVHIPAECRMNSSMDTMMAIELQPLTSTVSEKCNLFWQPKTNGPEQENTR